MPQAGERSTTSSNSSFKCWQRHDLSKFFPIFVLYLLWLGFKRHWCWGLSFLYLFYHNYIMIALLLCFEPSLDVKKVTFGTLCVLGMFFSFLFWGKSHQVCEKSFSLLLNQGMHALDYIIYKFTYLCVCSTWIKFKEQKHTT